MARPDQGLSPRSPRGTHGRHARSYATGGANRHGGRVAGGLATFPMAVVVAVPNLW